MEVAADDRAAVQSPHGSGSLAQEDQPLQQQASPRAAEEASEASMEPVREENDARCAVELMQYFPLSAGTAHQEVYSSRWANRGQVVRRPLHSHQDIPLRRKRGSPPPLH